MILETIWLRLSEIIDKFFYQIHLRKNWNTALIIEGRLGEYLEEKKIKYKIKVTDKIFMSIEPEVKIMVFIDMEYNKIIDLWNEVIDVAYEGIKVEDTYNIYISLEPMDRVSEQS